LPGPTDAKISTNASSPGTASATAPTRREVSCASARPVLMVTPEFKTAASNLT
jgi:hypothetical protein